MIRQLEEREKRALRRALGTRNRFALDTPTPAIKKTRDFISHVKADYHPPKARRGRCVLSGAARAAVDARNVAREEFFRALCG